ncbi:uncharacterized protein LOC124291076 [Haliotis rubra]|uniref:uncharacterized protein LOC124291076 n=1 Tax=Haliotis rubra TaxID=36100 RepID=UPI001EE5736D|nr:uncharacterized protein LOC124291076 [Haliotis rubra]
MEKLKVPELKDYLKKYGITTTGNRKDVLIALANAVVKLELEPDPDFQHDCRPETFMKQCLTDLHCDFDDPFALTYTSDFSLIPDFGLYDIFNYLLFHRSDYDRRKLKAFKSFEDYRLFYDGHVLDLQYCDISAASNLCAFKSKVKPTQKDSSYLGKPTYDMWFLMEKSTAGIKLAFCECPGGADGACRHIAASLYALEDFEKPSVTSGPCLWKRRALSQTEAVPIKKLRIETVGYGKEKQEVGEVEFDPRHPEDRQSLSQEAAKQFIDELTEVNIIK